MTDSDPAIPTRARTCRGVGFSGIGEGRERGPERPCQNGFVEESRRCWHTCRRLPLRLRPPPSAAALPPSSLSCAAAFRRTAARFRRRPLASSGRPPFVPAVRYDVPPRCICRCRAPLACSPLTAAVTGTRAAPFPLQLWKEGRGGGCTERTHTTQVRASACRTPMMLAQQATAYSASATSLLPRSPAALLCDPCCYLLPSCFPFRP